MPGSRVKNNCLGGTSRTLIARWRHDGSAKRRTCTLDTAPSGSAHPKHASQMEVPSPDDQDKVGRGAGGGTHAAEKNIGCGDGHTRAAVRRHSTRDVGQRVEVTAGGAGAAER